jgi:hypothetical protein
MQLYFLLFVFAISTILIMALWYEAAITTFYNIIGAVFTVLTVLGYPYYGTLPPLTLSFVVASALLLQLSLSCFLQILSRAKHD